MSKKYRAVLFVAVVAAAAVLAARYLGSHGLAVLAPEGVVASKERRLIITSSLLMLLVVVPVLVLTFAIAWKYREGNHKARYAPDWDHNTVLESIWWGIPFILIVALSVLAWNSSHELDPFRQLASANKPITIQVVALQWKWLFIYPEQNIASLNYVEFPKDTPINFVITSDAPMNSFWIPQLGGQVYAMSGMSTQLHLMADNVGQYSGSSANLSGKGFSGMSFIASSETRDAFDSWVADAQRSGGELGMEAYNRLAKPSENLQPVTFARPADGLYESIIQKYMGPHQQHGIQYIYGGSGS